MLIPGGSGSCRTRAKLGRSLALPLEPWTGSFQSAARLEGDVLTLAVSATRQPRLEPYLGLLSTKGENCM